MDTGTAQEMGKKSENREKIPPPVDTVQFLRLTTKYDVFKMLLVRLGTKVLKSQPNMTQVPCHPTDTQFCLPANFGGDVEVELPGTVPHFSSHVAGHRAGPQLWAGTCRIWHLRN